jgi:hypothetical protein
MRRLNKSKVQWYGLRRNTVRVRQKMRREEGGSGRTNQKIRPRGVEEGEARPLSISSVARDPPRISFWPTRSRGQRSRDDDFKWEWLKRVVPTFSSRPQSQKSNILLERGLFTPQHHADNPPSERTGPPGAENGSAVDRSWRCAIIPRLTFA